MTVTPAVSDHPPLGESYSKLAAWVQGLFSLYVALTAVSTGFALWQHSVFRAWANDPGSADAGLTDRMDAVNQVLSSAAVLCLLATGILFIRWLWLGVRSPNVDRDSIKYAPFWAIVSWFLPILNLFRPFQMVRNLWRGANVAKQTGAARNPQIVGWWWGILLLSFVSEQAVVQLTRDLGDKTGADFLNASAQVTLVQIGDNVLTATAAVLAALLVRKVTTVIVS